MIRKISLEEYIVKQKFVRLNKYSDFVNIR